MKNIVISMLALAFCAVANAKTLAELAAECPKYIPGNAEARQERLAYFEANKADYTAAFDAWKTSENSKLTNAELGSGNVDPDTAKSEREIREALMGFFIIYGAELKYPDLQGLNMNAVWFFKHNPSKYEQVKSSGWKIDGKEISPALRMLVALSQNDFQYAFANIDSLGMLPPVFLTENVGIVKKMLLSASDLAKAKEFCNAFEKAMILKNCTDGIDTIKTVGKYLTEKILENKITG